MNLFLIISLIPIISICQVNAQSHYLTGSVFSVSGDTDNRQGVRVGYEQVYNGGFKIGAEIGKLWGGEYGHYGMFGTIGYERRFLDALAFSSSAMVGAEYNCLGIGLNASAGIASKRFGAFFRITNIWLSHNKEFYPYLTSGVTIRFKI